MTLTEWESAQLSYYPTCVKEACRRQSVDGESRLPIAWVVRK